ncbi:methyltransferase domain-containing protein [Tardiphaga sp. 804_B3_N1_9]|uniref:methyltransferase domain-containing protein n=1 Tax=Tardiphaga sp. 804_B3_N1_9 TaxID=3240786 RepID=UPI003F22DEF4
MDGLRTSDLRCVKCSGGPISPSTADAYACGMCHAQYHDALGVPFFGDFEADDVLGLIEIAANAVNRGNFGVTPSVVEEWNDRLSRYHAAVDKERFLDEVPEGHAPYFQNRYGEWLEIEMLAEKLDLAGKAVLDLGAGLGFDSHRLALRGAHVTALEFSPLLAESGRKNFPHIRWIGGFSHCLPFKERSFDFVFCNAALHHMRDIPAAISEALRVLRRGGVLITTCDSFRPSNSPPEAELDIFDADTAVLLGVNECVPRFSDFVSSFAAHLDEVDVELHTHVLYGGLDGGTSTELTRWDYPRDVARLGARGGSIAIKAFLKKEWSGAPRLQTAGIVSARDYISWMDSAATALSRLTPLLSPDLVDLPFPGKRASKFELLNGWRRPQAHRHARSAYHRGRWFLTAPTIPGKLTFEVARPQGSAVETIRILLNGVPVQSEAVPPVGWAEVSVDLYSIAPGHTFCVEIEQTGDDRSLLGASFEVRRRRVWNLGEGPSKAPHAPVHVVIPVFNRLHFTRSCITDLKSQTYAPLHIIVADGGSTDGTVAAIRTDFPDVTVLTTDTELWWTGSMQMGIAYVLESNTGTDGYVLMLNNDTELVGDYVEQLVMASREFDAAVCGLIVDSRDPDRILDAGEYVDWQNYAFPVKNSIDAGDRFVGDVDVLPGRGSLVPLHMIRAAGNVDAELLPHYLADYEFFTRLKRAGFRLGVCCETKILAHVEETGIMPSGGRSSLRQLWREAFSRRSMNNVRDHWRFVNRHAPDKLRGWIKRRLARRVFFDFALRSQLRPIFLPLLWIVRLPGRIMMIARGQWYKLRGLQSAIDRHGWDVLCFPGEFPAFLRGPSYLLLAPGPISEEMVLLAGLDSGKLVSDGTLRRLQCGDWFAFQKVMFGNHPQARKLARLRRMAWNPFRKISNTLAWRRARASIGGPS